LLDLDSNKGPGSDDVPPWILKSCASDFAFLSLLLNRSLTFCVFLDFYFIFKSEKRNDVSNYRGIAILSTVGKLFELLLCSYEKQVH
jgi:hypothetical protein